MKIRTIKGKKVPITELLSGDLRSKSNSDLNRILGLDHTPKETRDKIEKIFDERMEADPEFQEHKAEQLKKLKEEQLKKQIPFEEKKVEVKLAVIEDIDTTNREIDTIGSTMVGTKKVNEEGVQKMINKSRKVGTLVGELFD